MISRVFIPPIKCQGIKSKLVSWILKNIEYKECKRWIEPFMGSGVVGFNAQHPNAIFGDINPHIINFYNSLKSSEITPLFVKQFLEGEGKYLKERGSEHFYFIRERFNKFHDPLDFLFLSRAGFNGMIRFNSKGKFNVPFCQKPLRFSKSYITKIVNQVNFVFQSIKMKNWNFVCGDFIERNWRGFHILTMEHFYHIGGMEKNRNSITEALILNYEPPSSCEYATFSRYYQQIALL